MANVREKAERDYDNLFEHTKAHLQCLNREVFKLQKKLKETHEDLYVGKLTISETRAKLEQLQAEFISTRDERLKLMETIEAVQIALNSFNNA